MICYKCDKEVKGEKNYRWVKVAGKKGLVIKEDWTTDVVLCIPCDKKIKIINIREQLRQGKKLLINWLKEVARFQKVENFVQWIENGKGIRFYVFTKENKYSIFAIIGEFKNRSYLGCQVSTRKPRAGEDWTRGNDLPDGDFSYKTWEKIKNAIIANELVKVAKIEKAKIDKVE